MNELSLFSGTGGGLLGTKLLGFMPVGYVENNDYCQRILKQRITDGVLENAPIFGDIKAFISDGYADEYKGMVDIITAGFPCQPFSIAGKQQGDQDGRNMWPETIDVIRRVRPNIALLENVPGLLNHEYARRIYGDLAESGYDAKWRLLSAAEVGAPHKRTRVFVICTHTDIAANGQQYQHEKARDNSKGKDTKLAHAKSFYAQGLDDGQREREPRRGGWWAVEPGMGRVVDGVANRVDRLTAIGNGQVPLVVKTVWELLNG